MSKLDEIEARLKAATPGPWFAARVNAFHTFVLVPASETKATEFIVGSQGMGGYGQDAANAALIAHAPADLAYLLRVARAAIAQRAADKAARRARADIDAYHAAQAAQEAWDADVELDAALAALESEAAS